LDGVEYLHNQEEQTMRHSSEIILQMEARLNESYAEVHQIETEQHDRYVHQNFNKLTRRTNFPKLGYFIHILNENGIACIVHGESAHAPMLWVEKNEYNKAYDLTIGNDDLDEMDDDDPQFKEYATTQPDTDSYV
jgi:hypothetical protein